jgi:D-threo-aldose 1-dehydrogenase
MPAGVARPTALRVGAGLGLGCAELFGLPSARARRRMLDAAFDAGIAHFDVAPMYGLGVAEAELGRFARTRRDRIVIATKFGIAVTPVGRALGAVQAPLRRLMRAWPGVRDAARERGAGPRSGAVGRVLYASAGYDGRAARRSLDRSLRALGVEHIDLLLLHDPDPGGVAATIGDDLEQLRADGLIGTWGVAGEPAAALAAAQALTVRPPVVQIRDDLLGRSLDTVAPVEGQQRITFGVLGEAIRAIVEHVRSDPQERRDWARRVGCDPGDPEAVAALLLRDARRRNPDGITLLGTTRPARVAAAVAAARDAGVDDRVDALVELVTTRIGRPPLRTAAG